MRYLCGWMGMTLRKILCVDDDPDARNLLAIALSTVAGFEVVVCGSAREAIAAVDDFAPDLVLLDDRMPATGGEQTLQLLRTHAGNRELPIIFLTAMTDRRNIDRLEALGSIAVMRKPFDPMTLGDDIRKIYRRKPAQGDTSEQD